MRTVDLLPSLDTQKVMRLTLTKGYNMCNPEEYAKIIERGAPTYVEAKAYMHVGFSRDRLTIENMPRHEEILEFARQIEAHSSYVIKDQAPESRVVLLSRK